MLGKMKISYTIVKHLQDYYYKKVNTIDKTANETEKVCEKECERPAREISRESNKDAQYKDKQIQQTCNRLVPFYCTTNVAAGFWVPEVITEAHFPRVVYNVSSLRCIIEPCKITCQFPEFPSTSPTVYQVKIVGCIPFRAEAFAVLGQCGGFKDDRQGSVCCAGSVYVDQPICTKDTLVEAKAVCDALTPLTSDDITIKDFTVFSALYDQTGERVVTFKGNFELPGC